MLVIITDQELASILNQYQNLNEIPRDLRNPYENTLKFFDHNKLLPQSMFPGVTDPTMVVYFSVFTTQQPDNILVDKLLQQKGIQSAYIKPSDELPI